MSKAFPVSTNSDSHLVDEALEHQRNIVASPEAGTVAADDHFPERYHSASTVYQYDHGSMRDIRHDSSTNINQFKSPHQLVKSSSSLRRSPSNHGGLLRKSFTSLMPAHSLHEDPHRHTHSKSICDALCMNPLCDMLPIIHPFGPFKMVWDFFVVALLCWTSLEVPYTMVFGRDISLAHWVGITNVVIDCLLLVDVALNFRTGYSDKYDQLHIIQDPRRIAKRYLRTWFVLDFVSSFPLEALIPLFIDGDAQSGETFTEVRYVFRIFRYVRAIKILRVIRIVKELRQVTHRIFYTRKKALLLKVIRCLVYMLLTAHYFACFWYMVGWYGKQQGKDSWIDANIPDDANEWEMYTFSWYWSVVTLFTTGYGDITAHNDLEQWTASICILVGTCFFAYFVGMFTNLIEDGDKVKMNELERVEEAQMFCSFHNLEPKLTRAIVTHVRYHCNYNYVHDRNELLSFIPAHLQYLVAEKKAKWYRHLDMFSELPDEVIGQLALRMTSVSCNRGLNLFVEGEVSHVFYIQRTGKAKLKYKIPSIHDPNAEPKTLERDLGRGDICGEYVLLSGRHRDTVHCLGWCEFYALDVHDVLDVLRTYYHVPRLYLKQYKYIKSVLRTTLATPPRRRAKFEECFGNQIDAEDDIDYIHELDSPKMYAHPHRKTEGSLTTAGASTIEMLPMSEDHEAGTTPIPHTLNQEMMKHPQPESAALQFESDTRHGTVRRRGTQRKLLKTFSMPFMNREDSFTRHNRVTKEKRVTTESTKVRSLTEDFMYADCEDSIYFSAAEDCISPTVADSSMLVQGPRRGAGRGGGKARAKKGTKGKFGKKGKGMKKPGRGRGRGRGRGGGRSAGNTPAVSDMGSNLGSRARRLSGRTAVSSALSDASIRSAINHGLTPRQYNNSYNEMTAKITDFVAQCAMSGTPIEISVHSVDPDVPMRQRFSLDHLDDINSGTEEEREIGVPPAQRQLSDPPSDHELSALEKDENVNGAHAHPIKPNTFTFNQGTSALNAVNENEGDFEADALDTLPQMTPGNSNKFHSGTPKEVTPFAQEASVSPFASPRAQEQVISPECAVSPHEEKEENEKNDALRGSPDSETFVRNDDDRDFSETMLSPNVDESPVNVKGSSTKMSYDQSSGSTRI